MSPLQLSIYTHGSKRSTFGLSTILFPRQSIYAPSKVTYSLGEATPYPLRQLLTRKEPSITLMGGLCGVNLVRWYMLVSSCKVQGRSTVRE